MRVWVSLLTLFLMTSVYVAHVILGIHLVPSIVVPIVFPALPAESSLSMRMVGFGEPNVGGSGGRAHFVDHACCTLPYAMSFLPTSGALETGSSDFGWVLHFLALEHSLATC